MNKNAVIHQSELQKGLYLYKTGRSPFYFVKIWMPKLKKYMVKSTKEKSVGGQGFNLNNYTQKLHTRVTHNQK